MCIYKETYDKLVSMGFTLTSFRGPRGVNAVHYYKYKDSGLSLEVIFDNWAHTQYYTAWSRIDCSISFMGRLKSPLDLKQALSDIGFYLC